MTKDASKITPEMRSWDAGYKRGYVTGKSRGLVEAFVALQESDNVAGASAVRVLIEEMEDE